MSNQVPLPEWELEALTDLANANELSGIPPQDLAGMLINESAHGEVGGAGVNPKGYGGYYGDATTVIPYGTLETSSVDSFIQQSETVASQLAGYGSSAGALGDVAIFNVGGGGSNGGVDWQASTDAQYASGLSGYDISTWTGTEPVGGSAGGADPTATQVSAAVAGSGYTTTAKVSSGGNANKGDPTATSSAPSVVPNIFNIAVPGVSGIDAVGRFFSGLSSSEVWIRVGEVLLGVVILAGSVVLFVAVLAAENKALSAVGAVAGLGGMLGLGKKAGATVDSFGAGASQRTTFAAMPKAAPAPKAEDSSYSRWWREGNKRTKREFGTGDTRESEDLSRWARDQARQSREISRRRTAHRADEDEF